MTDELNETGTELTFTRPQRSINLIKSLDDLDEIARRLAKSNLVPKDFRDKPEDCSIAIMMGMEIGLHPIQAIQSIAVINGRPTIWGDAMIALCRTSPVCEYINETISTDGLTARCEAKRRGAPEVHVVSFSKADAEKAKLWSKQGPWQEYPKRMLQNRARGFCLRDVFPDVLKGLISREEAFDIIDITPPPPKGTQSERLMQSLKTGNAQEGPKTSQRSTGTGAATESQTGEEAPSSATAKGWTEEQFDNLQNSMAAYASAMEGPIKARSDAVLEWVNTRYGEWLKTGTKAQVEALIKGRNQILKEIKAGS